MDYLNAVRVIGFLGAFSAFAVGGHVVVENASAGACLRVNRLCWTAVTSSELSFLRVLLAIAFAWLLVVHLVSWTDNTLSFDFKANTLIALAFLFLLIVNVIRFASGAFSFYFEKPTLALALPWRPRSEHRSNILSIIQRKLLIEPTGSKRISADTIRPRYHRERAYTVPRVVLSKGIRADTLIERVLCLPVDALDAVGFSWASAGCAVLMAFCASQGLQLREIDVARAADAGVSAFPSESLNIRSLTGWTL